MLNAWVGVLKSNGLIWEWVQDIYADKDWVKNKPRQQRIVRKGAAGKKLANEQPYLRKGIFQDSTIVDIGFRIVEVIPFKTTPYLIVEKSAITKKY